MYKVIVDSDSLNSVAFILVKVFVYYNLHKHCWSVRHKGKVIMHTDEVYLTDAKFKVSKAGRKRVLREKRKNVHAGVEGIMVDPFDVHKQVEVTYNPYKYESFVQKSGLEPVVVASKVYMKDKRVFLEEW